MNRKKLSIAAKVYCGSGVLVLAVFALSFVHPWGHLRSAAPGVILTGSTAPDEVRTLINAACGDCHSNNTHWPLYSRLAPASWAVEHDVKAGREHLNFSRWQAYSMDAQVDLLAKIASQLRQKKMPLKQYLLLHPEARLSPEQRVFIQDWAKTERKRLLSGAAK